MIELRNINKSYGNLHVLRDVNLVIEENQIISILGPSGAGKSTLLQIAGTLDKPSSGEVIYLNRNVGNLKDSEISKYRNRNIGFIFQFHHLLPELSACENVALPAMIGGMSRSKSMLEAASILETIGLKERLTHKPDQLSGGERQRVAIARALINRPMVVFADEPTGSLDSQKRDEIYSLICDLKLEFGLTFVVVSHDTSVMSISDRVIRMEDGRIVDDLEEVGQPEIIL